MLSALWELLRLMGTTSIDVYEWPESKVRMARLPNAPAMASLATKGSPLKFNGWVLAHAVVKADYLDRRNPLMPGLGFLLQAANIISFGGQRIHLRKGASKILNDVSSSSLSGRVGQGMAILFGHSIGLKFAAHLKSYVETLPAASIAAQHKDERMADFLFANSHQTCLIESKGSFSQVEDDPTKIKATLKDALSKQVDPWMGYLQPTPSNGYVVYTCLREPTGVPSAVFVVDPPGDDEISSVIPMGPEEVVRENYAAWLRAMGLFDVAERLLGAAIEEQVKNRVQVRFLIFEVQGYEYAVVGPAIHRSPVWCSDWPLVGMQLSVLKRISETLSDPRQNLSVGVENVRQNPIEENLEASVFPDGSILFFPDDDPLRVESILL